MVKNSAAVAVFRGAELCRGTSIPRYLPHVVEPWQPPGTRRAEHRFCKCTEADSMGNIPHFFT